MRDPEHRYKAKKSAMVDPAYFPLPFFIMQEVAQMTRGKKPAWDWQNGRNYLCTWADEGHFCYASLKWHGFSKQWPYPNAEQPKEQKEGRVWDELRCFEANCPTAQQGYLSGLVPELQELVWAIMVREPAQWGEACILKFGLGGGKWGRDSVKV